MYCTSIVRINVGPVA
jgi:hypothetical protein